MITVIVPTIWKSKITINLLHKLSKASSVSEIILIDNAPMKCPIESELDNILNLRRIINYTNNFVNPSWNQGVKISTNNFICLLNDDIIFDFNMVFNSILEKFKKDKKNWNHWN